MKNFKITTYQIPDISSNASAKKPLRMVVLADLHSMSYGLDNCHLIESVKSLCPELILVAGDMVISRPGQPVDIKTVLDLLEALVKIAPVYYSNGNHEYRMKIFPETYGDTYQIFCEGVRKLGVCLLENQNQEVVAAGRNLVIYGYELDGRFFKRFSREMLTVEEMNRTIGKPKKKGFHILLAHNPVFFETYAAWGADLTLSGHLHGGMIRLPLLGGVISPQVQLFPKYDKGLYKFGTKHMVVSAGLGSHSVKLRINNPPELIVVELGGTLRE